MGDYSYGEHLELFGGPPEPGEAYPDLEQVDAMRKAAKEDPGPLEPDGAAYPEVHLMTDEKPATCIICGQETHRIEEVARCVHELRRREKAE